MRLIAIGLAALLAPSCGGSASAPSPTSLSVQLQYVSPLQGGASSPEAGMCMHHVAPGGLVVARMGSAGEEVRLEAVPEADRTWRATVVVSAGRDVTVGIRDAYLCNADPQPASGLWALSGLSVNGTLVTRRGTVTIDTLALPAFVFRVSANNGRVQ